MRNLKNIFAILIALVIITSCSSNSSKETIITIYHVNDVHGQITNMAKIKHIIDEKRKTNPTILISSGDMFSGNPVVDNYKNPGYPMIDIMNQTGFNIATIGNHEFDYGDSILALRIAQSDFPWITANADLSKTPIKGVKPYKTLEIEEIKVVFLGLVETGGMQNALIPSTHPLAVKNIRFRKAQDIIPEYKNLKTNENADLYIVLSHLGHNPSAEEMVGDFEIAQQFPYFNAIIGAHTHRKIDTIINGTRVFQAGSYLNYLGQIDFKISDNKAEIINSQLIDLNEYKSENAELTKKIESYYNEMNPILDQTIGNSLAAHSRTEVGCFFTEALRNEMRADMCIQNTGGIRSKLDKGPITIREIYEIDPFNNGTIIYQITVGEIKKFLKESESGFYYSGLNISQNLNSIILSNKEGQKLLDTATIKLAMSDYTAAVHHKFFPVKGITFNKTSSEMLIDYLRNTKEPINYKNCTNYFKYE